MRLYAHVCPYCGRQYRGPDESGSRTWRSRRLRRCGRPGESGVTQPRLVRIEVVPAIPFEPLPIPHDVEPLWGTYDEAIDQ